MPELKTPKGALTETIAKPGLCKGNGRAAAGLRRFRIAATVPNVKAFPARYVVAKDAAAAETLYLETVVPDEFRRWRKIVRDVKGTESDLGPMVQVSVTPLAD